ncbi:hypothetical protein GH714_025927 [Hevea brasiliensis]|uniref:GTD-binding domain-containing protein n=1 Tax=Hevea brasiliensis TaxID=3981 RepID=A0A6A6KAL7_HEVBR|nr:hypothetical protein GH714_025927 [Hevea brasiliensis]
MLAVCGDESLRGTLRKHVYLNGRRWKELGVNLGRFINEAPCVIMDIGAISMELCECEVSSGRSSRRSGRGCLALGVAQVGCSFGALLRGMAFRAVHSWTLGGLIAAFIDLAIAYTLLCVSALAFVPSKFLSFFGFYLPCPCSGFFGYQNDDLCLHRLLIDWPIRKINAVQELAKNRFPLNLIWFGHESCNFHVEGVGNRKCGNGIFELEGETCCRSLSGPRFQSHVDRKKCKLTIGNAGLGYRDVPNGTDFSERLSHRFELDGSNGKGKGINRDQLSVENFTCDVEDSAGNDANVILVLEQALEEEKATHAALFQELEKERAAAATAVDEVMAMILRLQEDKASIEMEARQYQRVIEEKCAYDKKR